MVKKCGKKCGKKYDEQMYLDKVVLVKKKSCCGKDYCGKNKLVQW